MRDEWVLRKRLIALPSGLQVKMPDGFAEDVWQARAMHALLGRHAELLRKIRAACEKAPVEHTQIQTWFDAAGASAELKPQHVNWRPEYEEFYFEELRKRSLRWFVFQDEYLFFWRNVVISEIPASGRATYVFLKRQELEVFLAQYAATCRKDLRRDSSENAIRLGFIGRVIRGSRKVTWQRAILRHAAE